jgi:4-amino-4-deoxy-L-arabinose transferase-like glycosyltransferase
MSRPPPRDGTAPGDRALPPLFRALLLLLVAAGLLARTIGVTRPFDWRNSYGDFSFGAAWHQADYVQIARNYWRNDLDILRPRIDWSADTPGTVEMEFPVVPWLAAAAYRAIGYHEAVLRWISWAASLGVLGLFAAFARRTLDAKAAGFAVAAMAVNPILVMLAIAPQPDPMSQLLALASMALLWRWTETPRFALLLGSSACLAGAALVKAPAIFCGLVLAWAVLRRQGRAAFRDPRVWVAAMVALAPPIAWYAWSKQFWLTYGNSLGLSNETHLLSPAMLLPPGFLRSIAGWEIKGVLTAAGCLLALAALAVRRPIRDFAVAWYAAMWVFYLVAADTTGDGWASYYHAVSTAPACLLMGLGFSALVDGTTTRSRTLGLALGGITLAALTATAGYALWLREVDPDEQRLYDCARAASVHIPPGAWLLVRGGARLDPHGHPVAYNDSRVFAWMDRRGFTYAAEDAGLATVERFAARGARFWLARPFELRDEAVRRRADERWRLVTECKGTLLLYDLRADGRLPGLEIKR